MSMRTHMPNLTYSVRLFPKLPPRNIHIKTNDMNDLYALLFFKSICLKSKDREKEIDETTRIKKQKEIQLNDILHSHITKTEV